MRFSIIIPVHNSQDTLGRCLDSVFSSRQRDFEVIVVDSGSCDRSARIAKKHRCRLIRLKENKSPGDARNAGSGAAKGDILVFIDSDVVIKEETLDIIEESFINNNEAAAVTSILSKECPHKDFFTQYKNLYMHYIFKGLPAHVDFLYGSLMAVKKDHFLNFNGEILMEDTELGQRYKRLNKEILLNTELEVTHLKKYGLKRIITNDFLVTFWWAGIFLLHDGFKDIFKKKRFSHAGLSQIISIFSSYLLTAAAIFLRGQAARAALLSLLALFLCLNYKFFAFLYKERGFLFLIKSIIFTYLDMLVMGSGILSGFIHFNCFARKQCALPILESQ